MSGTIINYNILSRKNYLPSVIFSKFINTFIQIPGLYNLVIGPRAYAAALGRKSVRPRSLDWWLRKLRRIIERSVFFWPRVTDAELWAEAESGHPKDPIHFLDIDESAELIVNEVAARASSYDAPILDLGCNVGRALNRLAEGGFKQLYGVDISQYAIDQALQKFPALEGVCQIDRDFFQRYFDGVEERKFEIIFTIGATVELVHPAYPIINKICRATSKFVILLISEDSQSYPRFWRYELRREGFKPVKILEPNDDFNYGNLSLLVFKRA